MRSGRWLVFAILFAARTTIAYQFQSLASVGPYIVGILAIDFATLGILVGCYMLPGVALALPGVAIEQRFGAKRTIIVSFALMTAGVLIMAPGTIWMLFAGRLVSGAGAAILNVVLARTVSTWFAEGELAGVMGAFVASWPLGVALSLLSIPAVTIAFGWPALIVATILPSLLCMAFFATAYRDPDNGAATRSTRPKFSLTGREFQVAGVAGLIWGLYNVAYVVFVAALPELFIDKGFSLTESAALASVMGWVLIVSLPAGGYVSQRLGRGNAVMVTCFLIIAASAVCLAVTSATFASLAVLAVSIGLPAGVVLALPGRLLDPDSRSSGMGVFFTVFYIAMAALPGAAGIVRQQSGLVAAPILFGATALLAACLAVPVLARLSRRRSHDPDITPAIRL